MKVAEMRKRVRYVDEIRALMYTLPKRDSESSAIYNAFTRAIEDPNIDPLKTVNDTERKLLSLMDS